MTDNSLYLFSFFIAFACSVITVPIFRAVAIKLKILDNPITQVKTHKVSTPYLGGAAIALAWLITLMIIRQISDFPTGTLRSLRGIIYASSLIMLLGLIDDIKHKGLGYKSKLLIQSLAAAIVVIGFDIRINFISSYYPSVIVSMLWVIGITNALNIIDIMDGLSSGIGFIVSLGFLFISLPTEMIYVNFCAAALAGALLGFIPYNLSSSKKIFMGDMGSLFIGLILSALAMGTSYTKISEIGSFAPLLILAVPIYETFLVSWLRIRKGKSPFVGSKDHYALRLEKVGFSRKKILVITYIVCIILSVSAYCFTVLDITYSIMLFSVILIALLIISMELSSIKVE
ncbi:MAG: undecaprenyl/decaprenyl-phosphate alpha-N-acetylglucosaminyl 1-phosphate transferase [Elusimicrobiota bacterium]|jgi:UDP-GlcNAc:undecaprenyl-phosphate GlcNAc-1-phosphate transferase|nr:undecaprenyl/decaprenyl-phosphate alpha-N-acetylglucosaminyl 1-phosphate transferase [Elusimicrobiota bacterium]